MDNANENDIITEEIITPKAVSQNKKSKHGKLTVLIAVLLLFISAFALYFIYSNAKLDEQLEKLDYKTAFETQQYMPWLALTQPNLSHYLQGQNALASGDYAAAAGFLKNLGGYLDSADLYRQASTIARINDICASGTAAELAGALETLSTLTLDINSYSELINNLYAAAYNKAVSLINADVKSARTLLTALPLDYLDVQKKLEITEIFYHFQTNDSSTIYEETYDALLKYIDDPQAKEILLNNYFLPMFLNGKWETADGEFYFTQKSRNLKNGKGTHQTNLPHDKKALSADYDNASLYALFEGDDEATLMLSFECINENKIKVSNNCDGKTYEMTRVVD
ncbi:MAG: hypothetical protein RR052_03610 [Oscillospiraceae bacterium]